MRGEISIREGLGKLPIRPVYLVSCEDSGKKNIISATSMITRTPFMVLFLRERLSTESPLPALILKDALFKILLIKIRPQLVNYADL